MPTIDYYEVYEKLAHHAEREKIDELPPAMFAVQQDDLDRMRDHDAEYDGIFASAVYYRATHDDWLSWQLYMFREHCVFSVDRMELVVTYDSYPSAAAAADQIWMLCKLLTNGQIRVLQTHGPNGAHLASELFYVHGRHTVPITFTANLGPFMLHARLRELHTHVQRNRAMIDQIGVPQDSPLANIGVAASYDAVGRKIDWSEPEPLTYKEWVGLHGEPTPGRKYVAARIRLFIMQWAVGMAHWYTWAFAVISLLVCSMLMSVPVVGGWLWLVTWVGSTGWFAVWALPRVLEGKGSEDA